MILKNSFTFFVNQTYSFGYLVFSSFSTSRIIKTGIKTDIIIPIQRDHINSMFKKLKNAPIIKMYSDIYFIFLMCNFAKNSKILDLS